MLSKEFILEKLCYYDPRNPYFAELGLEVEDKSTPCYCDSCFGGTHDLANELLELREITK